MQHETPEQSPPTPTHSREVRVGKSATGLGIFSRRWYREHMIIGEIEGDVVADAHYGSQYCFDMEDGSYLEPIAPFRYINHSCQSNCEFEVFELIDKKGDPPRRRLMLSALTDIRPGEELTIDYNWPLEGAIACKCGARQCRGWVVGAEELTMLLARQAAEKSQ